MLNFLTSLLAAGELIHHGQFYSPAGLMPHGMCYLWKPGLLWLHIVSDSIVALAYYSIPITLIYFVHHRRDVPFSGVFWLFGAFIIACGTTHIMEVWTLWHPNYWTSGILKAFTAVISLYTAIELIPLLPQALALPSPAQLALINENLEKEITERQKREARLIQTEKMSSLGQLVAGIAHEINNPVNFIYGNLTYTQEYIQELLKLIQVYTQAYPNPVAEVQKITEEIELDFLTEDVDALLASMKAGAERIHSLVLNLRVFSRLDEASMKAVDIHSGIDSALLILQSRLNATQNQPTIEIVKEYSVLPLVECYAGDLNQVFMNILCNAIDAIEMSYENEGIKNYSILMPTIKIRTEVMNKDSVAIRIKDNGPGMNLEVQQRIFDPFFTTKPVGKGNGLGLSTSYQIVVEKHGGNIECLSTSKEGTEFMITIPIKQ